MGEILSARNSDLDSITRGCQWLWGFVSSMVGNWNKGRLTFPSRAAILFLHLALAKEATWTVVHQGHAPPHVRAVQLTSCKTIQSGQGQHVGYQAFQSRSANLTSVLPFRSQGIRLHGQLILDQHSYSETLDSHHPRFQNWGMWTCSIALKNATAFLRGEFPCHYIALGFLIGFGNVCLGK